MQLSYWEHQSFFKNVDICIVGSGIVGLFAALELKNKAPEKRILVLERGFLPYGASTRNAGFACFGSVSELQDDLTKMSENEVFNLVERRYKGLLKLRKTLGEQALGMENNGGYELFTDSSSWNSAVSSIDFLNRALKSIIGNSVYEIKNDAIQNFGFKSVEGIMYNRFESQVDTGNFLKSLLNLVRSKGVEVLTGIQVTEINEKCIRIGNDFDFKAEKIIIATNGFASQFLPDFDVQPARAQVLVTKSISNLKLKGTFHYDHGYYYFRNIGDHQILLGGGRNLDFDAEYTTEMDQTSLVQNALENLLKTVIIPGTVFEIERRWSGIMGVGSNRVPIVKSLGNSMYCAVRMGGMGVALGSLVGEEVADLVLADC